ncbi:GNAT family N-acetyltransferase, partial [Enterobacter hormaechei]
DTAEFKRIWTLPGLRRQGIARRVLQELEEQAARQGYRRVFLTTGFRQPEAVGLYLSHGYTALFDLDADPESIAHLPFEKHLRAPAPVVAPVQA